MEDRILVQLGTESIRNDVDSLLKTATDGHVIKLANLVRSLCAELDSLLDHCKSMEKRFKK